jgi:hypothetical protein
LPFSLPKFDLDFEFIKTTVVFKTTVVCNRFNVQKMRKQREPIRLLLTWIRGAVGKEFVIKHYKYGVVKTKFPDMTRIIASARQRKCRNLFKEAVEYAKSVYADPVKKKEWQKKTRKKHRVFNRIVKDYMLAAKESSLKRQEAGTRIIRRCFDPLQKMDNENCAGLPFLSAQHSPNFVETG